jgi:hypothetical protein
MKFHDAITANTGFIPQVIRYLREQRVRYFHFGAPTRAFIGINGAKLAIVLIAT